MDVAISTNACCPIHAVSAHYARIWREAISAIVRSVSMVMHVALVATIWMNACDRRADEMRSAGTMKAVFSVRVRKVIVAIQ